MYLWSWGSGIKRRHDAMHHIRIGAFAPGMSEGSDRIETPRGLDGECDKKPAPVAASANLQAYSDYDHVDSISAPFWSPGG
jgi:hypothetical protein